MGKHPPGTDVGGRPTEYIEKYDIIAENLVADNKTYKDIGDIIGVDERTIYRWQNEHESFCQALKRGRERRLDKVEYNMYERAYGIKYTEEKKIIEGKQDKDGVIKEGSRVRIEKIERYVPPDTGAMCFILKTQRPDAWKEVQNMNITEIPTIIDDIEEGD